VFRHGSRRSSNDDTTTQDYGQPNIFGIAEARTGDPAAPIARGTCARGSPASIAVAIMLNNAPINASAAWVRERSRPLLLAMRTEHEGACRSVQKLSHNMWSSEATHAYHSANRANNAHVTLLCMGDLGTGVKGSQVQILSSRRRDRAVS
jgi:hypothetical protein